MEWDTKKETSTKGCKGMDDEYEDLGEYFDLKTDKDAKKKRDKRARELRKEGWLVQIETKATRYCLFAERKRSVNKMSESGGET